jgi:predicted CXXCH cytochrome family protein
VPLRTRSSQLSLVVVVFIAFLSAVAWWYVNRAPNADTPQASPPLAAYADPAKCALCHSAIAATYEKTGMARAFHRVGGKKGAADPAPAKPYYHAPSDSYFAMLPRDGALYQRRWQITPDGKETNVDEKRVDFVLGSGNHARTYLHLTAKNTLQQLPLGWYAENGGTWAMNPGYDRPDYAGSVRPIFYECMFCHNGYPKIPTGPDRDFSQTTYLQPLPEGIDCQRCHGPGQNHVDQASKGPASGPALEAVRAAILNPAKLSPEKSMEVCLQCHLETSNQKLPTEVARFDRLPFSYLPGQPLAEYKVSFDRQQGNLANFEIAQGAYRLRASQCFLQSQGKLGCTTCHNPHDIQRGAQAVTQYNKVCLNCHPSLKAAAAPHTAGADCIACHMPKRRTDDAIHVVMTEHLITSRPPPGDLLAAKSERPETTSYQGQVVPYYPPKLPSTPGNDLLLAVAQVREQSNLTIGITQLAAAIQKHRPAQPAYYAELAEAYLAAGNTTSAIQFFEEAAKRDPRSAPRLTAWGDALMQAGQWAAAETHLRRATELSPSDVRAWGRLGWALWQQNKAPDARAALEKGIALDPEVPELRNNLGLLLLGTGDPAGAEKEFRAAIRIQPGVAEWRLTLARLLASQRQIAEAAYQLEQALRSKPAFTDARIVYAHVLADMNRPADAEAQTKLAVQNDPNSADAHELWGGTLAAKGDLSGARTELSEAVRLQPANARARIQLGMVLANLGDRNAAIQHLSAAAQAPDPNIRNAAQQALRQLTGR